MNPTLSTPVVAPVADRRSAREVLTYCNELLNQNPAGLDADLLAKVYVERGAAHAGMDDLEAARQDFLAAAEHKADFAAAYNNLAGILIRQGDFAAALDYACRAVTIDPYEHDNNLMVAHEGQRMSAKIEKEPTATLHYKRALLFESQGIYDLARDDLLRAVEQDPDFHDAWGKLGDVYQKLGEPEMAVAAYDELGDRVHDYAFRENQLSLVKYWTHRIRKIACNGTADDYADVGALFVMQETQPAFSKARPYLQEALKRNPGHPAALFNLSIVETLLHEKGYIDLAAETAGGVPDVVGLTRRDANATLRQSGYRPRATYRQVAGESQHGLVIETQPPAGTPLAADNIVAVVVGHPGLSLESLEGIGPVYRQKLTDAGIATLNLLAENPAAGDEIEGIGAARSARWANMAQWLLAYAGEMDGNAVELLVVGAGLNSPEEGYEAFAGQSAGQIKETLRAAGRKVKLPAGYLAQNSERLAELLMTLS